MEPDQKKRKPCPDQDNVAYKGDPLVIAANELNIAENRPEMIDPSKSNVAPRRTYINSKATASSTGEATASSTGQPYRAHIPMFNLSRQPNLEDQHLPAFTTTAIAMSKGQ